MSPTTCASIGPAARSCRAVASCLLAVLVLPCAQSQAQELTGSLIGKVVDEQGAAVKGAEVRVASPARIGAPALQSTDDRGQWRFSALPSGIYSLDVTAPGMT